MATGGAVDERGPQTYYSGVMKRSIFHVWVPAVLLAGLYGVYAEDLDAALAEQKQKAQRRVYSSRAVLEEQDLQVPRDPTSEELELDRKLREMEAALDAEAEARGPGPVMQPRPAVQAVLPEERNNWLTPAILDERAAMSVTNDAEDSWVAEELLRQREQRALLEAAEQERARTDRVLLEQIPQQSAPGLDRIRDYQPVPQGAPGSPSPAAASYMTPQSGIPDPLAAIRPGVKNEAPVLFSPAAVRPSAAMEREPFEPARRPSFTPRLGSAAPQSRTEFSSEWNEPPAQQPLSPLESIRRSAPIHRDDPFSEDLMPQIKTSIWE